MKVTINLGLDQRPVTLTRQTWLGADYRVHYDYLDDITGSKVALLSTCDAQAWLPAHGCVQYVDFSQPTIPAGAVIGIEKIEFCGYKGCDFEVTTL